MEERHLSLSDVARVMGVSERTVRRWIQAGKLRAYKPGRDYRISETALREFIEESEVSPKAAFPLQLELGVAGEPRATEVGEGIFHSLTAGIREEMGMWRGDSPARAPGEMRAIAENMQNLFMQVFTMVEQDIDPREWPDRLKAAALEAGAYVQVMAEAAVRAGGEAVYSELPEVLTSDPTFPKKKEKALAGVGG